MLIPTKYNQEPIVTDLPTRASVVTEDRQKAISGGCQDRYKCWVRTFALCGPAYGHDYFWGVVEIPRGESSDAKADYLCHKWYSGHAHRKYGCSYRGIHSQWIGCW